MKTHFDIIIAGAGAAGLWTAYHLAIKGYEGEVLLVDKDLKEGNDHTWSFWSAEKEEITNFAEISWDKAAYSSHNHNIPLDLGDYKYRSTGSAVFYERIKSVLNSSGNFSWLKADVKQVKPFELDCSAGLITAKSAVINSIYSENQLQQQSSIFLWQHFYGEIVRFKDPVFKDLEVGFMDFSIDQEGDCRFLYTLPYSEHHALLEYTIFSKDLLPQAEYKSKLSTIITERFSNHYLVEETEFGKIPMCDYRFQPSKEGLINIGTAGGMIKASTGFGFRSMFYKTESLVTRLISTGKLEWQQSPSRYQWFDKLFLRVISKDAQAEKVFDALFSGNPAHEVLDFLDEKQSLTENLKIIKSCPTLPFIKAMFSM